MIQFEYYRGFGIEYCLGVATIDNTNGIPLKHFEGGLYAIDEAKKFIDKFLDK